MTSPTRLIVIAKAPVPGRVKTRLSPPYSAQQASDLAAASIADTLDAVRAVPGVHRVIAFDGDPTHPAVDLTGFDVLPQRGDGLGPRLAHAFTDADRFGVAATLLVGMDTPQLTPATLSAAVHALTDTDADAVLGLAEDGGWWALGLRDAGRAGVLADVPMSRGDTGELTELALLGLGLTVAALPELLDVDTVADALAVAAIAPHTRFARAIRDLLPATIGDRA